MKRFVRGVRSRLLAYMAASHTVGSSLSDAAPVCAWARDNGWRITIGPWVGDGDDFDAVTGIYIQTAWFIASQIADGHLSIKTPDFGGSAARLDLVLAAARETRVRLQFDSLSQQEAPASLALLERACARYDNIGCTLPARWGRSAVDAERAIALGAAVRVVRGQWPDPVVPHPHVEELYLQLIDRLAGRAREVMVATHNAPLARLAIGKLLRSGTPAELEQMFGLPMIGARLNGTSGVPLRLYVPFGRGYFPFNVRDVCDRPAVARWLLRDMALGRRGKMTHYT